MGNRSEALKLYAFKITSMSYLEKVPRLTVAHPHHFFSFPQPCKIKSHKILEDLGNPLHFYLLGSEIGLGTQKFYVFPTHRTSRI